MHLPHCGLVVLSRGGICNDVSEPAELLESSAAPTCTLDDAFLLAGAQSVVLPLWNSDLASLPNTLLLLHFYSLLANTGRRPVAIALQRAQQWLRRASFHDLRAEVLASRLPDSSKLALQTQLWSLMNGRNFLSHAQQRSLSEWSASDVRGQMVPFSAAYWWAPFKAVGACTGTHSSELLEVGEGKCWWCSYFWSDKAMFQCGPRGAM